MAHDLFGAVGDEQDGLALADQMLETAETFRLELHVAHRQRLVDQQHVGIDAGGDGKGQAHEHAAGIVLHRLLDEITDVGEGEDFIQTLFGFGAAQTKDAGVQEDVLDAGEIRIEAGAEFQQGGDPAAHADLAPGRRQGTGEHLQERRLTRTVTAQDTDDATRLDGEVDLVQRPELLVQRPAGEELDQSVARIGVDMEAFAQAADLDGVIVVAGLGGVGRRGHRRLHDIGEGMAHALEPPEAEAHHQKSDGRV
jgi:hypothetical protein